MTLETKNLDQLLTEKEAAALICYSQRALQNWRVRGGGPCLLYTSPSPRDQRGSRMPSSA